MSKVKLALGAASLFLFIVGVKRSFEMEDGDRPDGPETAAPEAREQRPGRARRRRNKGSETA